MVYTVRKPYTLQVKFQCFKIFCIVLNTEVSIDGLKGLPYQKIVPSVLVERDVTPEQCRLGKIENQCLLL